MIIGVTEPKDPAYVRLARRLTSRIRSLKDHKYKFRGFIEIVFAQNFEGKEYKGVLAGRHFIRGGSSEVLIENAYWINIPPIG